MQKFLKSAVPLYAPLIIAYNALTPTITTPKLANPSASFSNLEDQVHGHEKLRKPEGFSIRDDVCVHVLYPKGRGHMYIYHDLAGAPHTLNRTQTLRLSSVSFFSLSLSLPLFLPFFFLLLRAMRTLASAGR